MKISRNEIKELLLGLERLPPTPPNGEIAPREVPAAMCYSPALPNSSREVDNGVLYICPNCGKRTIHFKYMPNPTIPRISERLISKIESLKRIQKLNHRPGELGMHTPKVVEQFSRIIEGIEREIFEILEEVVSVDVGQTGQNILSIQKVNPEEDIVFGRVFTSSISDLPEMRRIVRQVNSLIDLSLDETTYCCHCRPDAQVSRIDLIIQYKREREILRVDGITLETLQLVYEFIDYYYKRETLKRTEMELSKKVPMLGQILLGKYK